MTLNIFENKININIRKYIQYNNISIDDENNDIRIKIIRGRYPIDILREIVYFHEKLKEKYGENTIIQIKIEGTNKKYNSNNIVEYKKRIKQLIYYHYINNKENDLINLIAMPR